MYQIPEGYSEELAHYRQMVEEAQKGEMDPVGFKIYRVVRGIYEQRTKGTYMVRIRCSGGVIRPQEFYEVGNIAARYQASYVHITTRQELQLHNLRLEDTPDVLEDLYHIGLSTKGSGGNTVRNITASVDSGVSVDEVFDVTPYQLALTNYLIALEKSFDLPRKLKIAFSNSDSDTALTVYNDLGFMARMKDGVRGFKVYLGGSPSVKAMVGEVLFEFVPADQLFAIARAVVELFHIHGNRKNRHKARLRYLFYKLGADKVKNLFAEFYNQFSQEGLRLVTDLPANTLAASRSSTKAGHETSDSLLVKPQRQKDFNTIEIPVMHGNLRIEQLHELASIADNYGDDSLRFSRRQNIHLRYIPSLEVEDIIKRLKLAGFPVNNPGVVRNLVSCTGADTCQLGICFSKGGLQAIHDKLETIKWSGKVQKLAINISGCPNGCGQHLVADLGFAGRVSRNGQLYPSYHVYGGAIVGADGAALPNKLGEVAAKDLPEFTHALLQMYQKHSCSHSFPEFLDGNAQEISALFSQYSTIPSYEENPKYYIDWGNNDLFTLDARGGGECSAGLLDRIESEITIIEKCKESYGGQQEVEEQTVLLHQMVLSASKLLVLTRKQDIASEVQILEEVQQHFIAGGFISGDYQAIVEWVKEGNFSKLIKAGDSVQQFTEAAIAYYRNLDDSLQLAFEVQEIGAKELHGFLNSGEETIHLIDVREAWEKEIADLGGELIPLGRVLEQMSAIPTDAKTVIYCRTGRRSSEAIHMLAEHRSTHNLYNLTGGIYAWADEVDASIQKY